jgi:pimeloyl-ACP methyl ester carboxylesterase
VSHLDIQEEPPDGPVPSTAGLFSRLIVFDKRGTGMSDRSADEDAPLLEDRVKDIATLMDTLGSERAAMMGLSETGAVALLFAATYPERTSAVVAYGSFAGKGGGGPIYPWVPDPEAAEWLEDLEQNWGRGVFYLEDFAPSLVGVKRYEDWYAKLERLSVSPGPPSRWFG